MRSRLLLIAAAVAGVALAAHPALAQHRHHHDDDYDQEYDDDSGLPRGYLGGELMAASPQGEFRDYVNSGWGGGIHYLLRADRDGWLALRVDASLLNYGHERQRVPLSSTIGGRIAVDLVTDNNIAFIGAGPQIGLPTGTFRPYVNGFVGVSYIFTESSVRGSSSGESFASSTNYDDASFAYGGGAGLYIPVARRGRNPVSIDLGAQYRHNGQADYLVEGGITDNPDGSITLDPIRSETNLFSFHVGVSVGVR
jgi:opacity protein-like surface antigen